MNDTVDDLLTSTGLIDRTRWHIRNASGHDPCPEG